MFVCDAENVDENLQVENQLNISVTRKKVLYLRCEMSYKTKITLC